MAKKNRPRSGSLAFWPRKRSKRIYPTVTSFKEKEAPGILGFACYKAGMTHVMALDNYEKSPSFGQTISIPSTIIETPPLFFYGVRAYEKTPYGKKTISEIYAEKLDKALGRKISLPKKQGNEAKKKKIESKLDKIAEIRALVHTQPGRIKLKKTPEVMEFTIAGKPEDSWKWALENLGKEIKLTDIFKEGDVVDVTAVTTGKGTQGPVKRFGIKIQIRKAHGHRRFPGSIGSWTPPRVQWRVPMSGQTGFQRRTEFNKRILKISSNGAEATPKGGFVNYGVISGDYIILTGSVPGPRKRLLVIRHALRVDEAEYTALPEIKEITQYSQQ